jgi:eukaryotic-like serine/threonine-protein kinase
MSSVGRTGADLRSNGTSHWELLDNCRGRDGHGAFYTPEQACGGELDVRTDLFSFGAVLYEMATGKPAFEGASTSAVYRAVLTFTPLPASNVNPRIPTGLDSVIGKALEKDRE